jgi:hypothetical protein
VRDHRATFFAEPSDAINGSQVIITGLPLGMPLHPRLTPSDVAGSALILPLDDDASLEASVANSAAAFFVDDCDDFRMRQDRDLFRGWRQPDGTVAGAIARHLRPSGVVVCANQGLGVLDAVFAQAVLTAAERDGAGSLLER